MIIQLEIPKEFAKDYANECAAITKAKQLR